LTTILARLADYYKERKRLTLIYATDEDLGVIVSYEVDKPQEYEEYQIAVVEVAMKYGYDINTEIWEEDKPKFFTGEADQSMREDLFYAFDYCVQWLNEELSEGYELETQDGHGLVLIKST
jgi:hypothetical protein